jgi:ADP-L-glycero-D-manno-heptose 6-epimerase
MGFLMWLVTGSSGFIGGAVVSELRALGIEVIRCDFRDAQGMSPLEVVDFIGNTPYSEYKVTGVIHLGAISSTTETDSTLLVENNVLKTLQLFDACADLHIPFIYASSAAVYGNGSGPISLYGKSKAWTDELILSKVNAPQRWYGLRLHNVYGPGEASKRNTKSMVAQCYDQIVERGRVELFYGERTAMRDFVYIKDVVASIIGLTSGNVKSGIYDIGIGNPAAFSYVADRVFHELMLPTQIDLIPIPRELVNQYQYKTCADVVTWVRETGLAPKWSLEDGISDYVHNYLIPRKSL